MKQDLDDYTVKEIEKWLKQFNTIISISFRQEILPRSTGYTWHPMEHNSSHPLNWKDGHTTCSITDCEVNYWDSIGGGINLSDR